MQTQTINPKRNRLMFSLGTSGRDMYYNLYSAQMLNFILFTKTLNDAQFAAVSMILVGCRVFDAVIDPFIGGLVENTRSRWGRFKPWIAIGMVSAAVLTVLLFVLPYDGWDFIVLFAIATVLMSFTYSLNDIAYWGMLPTLTSDQTERSRLTALSAFCGSVGAAIAVVTIPTLTNGERAIGGSSAVAFPVLAVICSMAMMGTQLFTIFGTKEPRINELKAEKAPRLSLGDLLKVVTKNDQLLWSSLSIFLQRFGGAISESSLLMFYIFMRFGYNGMLVPVAQVGFALGGVTVNAILAKWHGKYGRKKCADIGALLFIAGNIFILINGLLLSPSSASPQSNPLFITLVLGLVLTGFGGNLFYLTMLVSIANSVEYNEYRTGNRQEGLIFSVRPFVLQNSTAATQATVAGVLILLGLNKLSNNISALENQVKKGLITDSFKNDEVGRLLSAVGIGEVKNLLMAITIIPIILMALACFVYRRKYFIDEAYYEKMQSAISERQSAEDLAGE